ncbi:tetratricopeptide repeat protein [uncultured Caulobacter sp.]|uniref:tetratricopeptide repeat protein n=1 Tax=uncultured Caulobacter sp. TaxID=158749 RepID=UPI00260DFE66|nr:tetratricopeptide repeat protein [uncultured Caulobacter sp.]
MSRKSALEMSASALAQADVGAAPVHAGQIGGAIGDAASNEAIARLKQASQNIKNAENSKMLVRAVQAVHAGDYVKADKLALKLLQREEQLGLAWHILAIAREKNGDYASSLRAYEAAVALLPDQSAVAGDLGRLAFRMNMPELAAKFFAHYRLNRRDDIEASNNLACALREMNRDDEAIEVLKEALALNPEATALWNTLGTVLCNMGRAGDSLVFFEESLRLDPDYAKAWHNRAFAKCDLGDIEGALVDCEAALKLPAQAQDVAIMRFARSTLLLALGRLEEGWKAYEARFSPELTEAPLFYIGGTRWTGQDLTGKAVLIVAEQGLGDEVMFASMLPDIIERLGAKTQVTLAVERRLVPLFQRSFPDIEVLPHRTVSFEGRVWRTVPDVQDWSRFDYWTALGAFLPTLRGSVADFPARDRFLAPDPERVAYWKAQLEALGPKPKVGLLWKSLVLQGERARQFSPFQHWEPVLKTPGVTFINLQYGDCAEEIAFAKEAFGVEIWQPPGIDLKQDLDDVTALCAAVDLVIGFSNATTNLAAAAGAPLWLITIAKAWTRLGAPNYPWYPQARCFVTETYRDWTQPMADIAEALAVFPATR